MYNEYNSNQGSMPTSPDQPTKVVRFDKAYVRTLPGILKVVQLLSNIIGFICIKVSSAWVSPILYNLVYWIGNIITGFLLLFYTFHIVEKWDSLPWLKMEFVYCAIMTLSYIIAAIFAITIAEAVGYAVGFFGMCAMIAYGADGYLKYRSWKRGMPPQ